MKLRNKKTGEIGEPRIGYHQKICIVAESHISYYYETLSAMFEEWEDYEEPKEVWTITTFGEVQGSTPEEDIIPVDPRLIDRLKQIGNYFETKEEVEKAVEKLKAWKRLKDKGFRVYGWDGDLGGEDHYYCCGQVNISAVVGDENKRDAAKADLDLLFGDEE